ncbi:manganese efflux pump [Paenibacillus sabinae]|uniref:Sporulation protein YtaF n=1 Tax=Paenibacillus sabinae T27 TaxID=1268072 RepID=X4ZWQ9_9BACL|nr:manganese efflux pump [Paenibacillus sabinae]AHV96673.1 sporulation protein YtaF [Paenibacillus sabinae T27]
MISPIFSLLLLAFALSLDGFGVGITYGLRKLKIPLLSVLIISFCSGVVMCVSMQVGSLLAKIVSPHLASLFGAVIILLMGCWSLVQLMMQKEGKPDDEAALGTVAKDSEELPALADGAAKAEPDSSAVFSWELRRLGIVIQILRTPSSADMDQSGSISSTEALVLGIALSLDAFGAGLGAALLGFNPLWTSLVIALFSGSILVLGLNTGLRFAGSVWMKRASVLPALLLIAIGILKLL